MFCGVSSSGVEVLVALLAVAGRKLPRVAETRIVSCTTGDCFALAGEEADFFSSAEAFTIGRAAIRAERHKATRKQPDIVIQAS
ncbi:hypothetical protein AA0535_0264 [Asaia krungthepensis NRIC 0535]|uniref:Uncharacterized protein n=1 Tax=Asaia krungthepensis NRIC 0535 TaxID=1307925 RepID=A0ABQ0PWS2_9PROT|nr:hypothetical protein AA0535_0264 [Asaia krungthepensis NRIC 0535]